MIEYYEFQNFAGEYNYLPSMIFCTENPYSKLFLDRTYLIDSQFSKILQHTLGQTN